MDIIALQIMCLLKPVGYFHINWHISAAKQRVFIMQRLFPAAINHIIITSITGDLRPPWAIKAQFSTRPNWASKTMVFLVSTFP